MGDRCYMTIMVREKDVKTLEDKLGMGNVLEHVSPTVTFSFDEVNYGAFTEREDLARDGLVFYGWHGSGGEYGPHEFAAHGGNMIDIPLSHEGQYYVRFNQKTGKVEKGGVAEVKAFLNLKNKAKAFIKRQVK